MVTAKLISAFVLATRIVQSLYFLNPKFQTSSHLSVAVQPGLCETWSETPKTGFLRTRLKFAVHFLCVKVKPIPLLHKTVLVYAMKEMDLLT